VEKIIEIPEIIIETREVEEEVPVYKKEIQEQIVEKEVVEVREVERVSEVQKILKVIEFGDSVLALKETSELSLMKRIILNNSISLPQVVEVPQVHKRVIRRPRENIIEEIVEVPKIIYKEEVVER
jgi:hypothetical protein